MRHSFDDELQISEFIKDPASLKLLILAGTNIRANQLMTVNKCISLIKLDLSSNQLAEVPLKFNNFPQMKIVYLHENQINTISITRTNLEYISLFDNPIKDYRAALIDSNEKLMAIDHHVIAKSERLFHTTPHPFSLLKWPIVQISQSLEHEEDYLNLLKAELFVVSQVYKRANFADVLNRYFLALKDAAQYQRLRHTMTNQAFFQREFIKVAANHWLQYTQKKKKLRRLFEGTPAEDLILNKLERIRKNRSSGVSEVLGRFLKSVRERMVARLVLARSLAAYRSNIPVFKFLQQKLETRPLKLYFLESQAYFLQKIFLYAKKQFFNRKEFDILDNFDQLAIKSKKMYYIYRRTNKGQADTILLEMVRNSMGLVLGEKGVDKRSIHYNRLGHKRIQIKKVKKMNEKYDKERTKIACEKVDRLYNRYDLLVQYEFKNKAIYQHIMRLIKFFNAGNSHVILQNQAAYFQTEVIFEDKSSPKARDRLFFSCYYYAQRAIAANAIQKWWRRMQAVRKCERNLISEMRVNRAQNLIGRWFRDLTFRHRMQLTKHHSFAKSTFKQIELLMQLEIYMSLPIPQDFLRFKGGSLRQQTKYIYEILHKNTEVEIVEVSGRSWIKFRFLTAQDAFEAMKEISIITYRYYFNGTFLKLFSPYETNFPKDLAIYEDRVDKLFHLKVNAGESQGRTAKRIQIDNMQPYFIWPYLDEGFASMFKPEEVQSLPISVFIYNKNRRPLKVNCDLMWITPLTLYHFRKRVRPQVRVRTPKKEKQPAQSNLDHYMPHIQHKLRRERQFSMKQHKSLLQANRERGQSQHVQLSLLSETLNIKRQ